MYVYIYRVFPSGGPYVPPHDSCVSPIKSKNCPPHIFVDHDKIFLKIFFQS